MKKTFVWFRYLIGISVVSYWIAQAGLILLDRIAEDEELEKEPFYCRRRRPNMTFLTQPRLENLSCNVNNCLKDKTIKWKMVTIVKSVPENFVFRKAIRDTWATIASVEKARFHTIFIIGKAEPKVQLLLDKEQEAFQDILQIDLQDKYSNVVYKTLAGMQWAVENLPPDYFYSTADDDMIVNLGAVQDHIDNYMSIFNDHAWSEFPLICMHVKRIDWGPIRDVRSKYNVSHELYKWSYYPDFCLGGMYTTSVRLVAKLWEASRWERPLTMDDAWITGILREKIHMPWQLVYKIEPSAARHNYVFSVQTEETTRKAMMEDWAKQFDRFKSKSICFCKQDTEKVQLKIKRPNLPLAF